MTTETLSISGSIRECRSYMSRLCAVTILGTLIVGCDRPAPEERLQATGEELSSAADELTTLSADIEDLENTLDDKKSERRRLKSRLQTLEERLRMRATDVALFRAVQSALLEDESLQETGVSVSVEDGIVTLRGVVESADARDTARNIAQGVTGVETVVNRIRVEQPDPKTP